MIPQRWIEAYLRFLLRNRRGVAILVAVMTAFFAYSMKDLRLHTDFFDFYPRRHPYIQFYNEFRRMFGTANVMNVILEVKKGDIYNPETLQKLDRITKFMINTKGVVPYQILSIAHPAVNSATVTQGSVQVRPVFYPGVPKTQEDADRVRFAVYANPNIRGLYVANDDTAAVVNTGFWEEALDFHYLNDRMMELKRTEEDANHTIYITGFPWLYTSVLQYAQQLRFCFWIHLRGARVPALRVFPYLDRHLGADLLRYSLQRLGAGDRRPARVQPRSAGAGHPDLPDGACPQPFGAVNGPLPRGVLPAERPASSHRRVVLSICSRRRSRPSLPTASACSSSPWRRSR